MEEPARGSRGFEALAEAIIYQQISGAAGDAILRRLRRSAGARRCPPARWFLKAGEVKLRACGLSPQKLGYLQDLARRVEEHALDLRALADHDDEQAIAALTEVHGIGRWTAEMYLIFALRRPDVLPVDDLGVKKAIARVYGFRELPSRRTMLRLGEPWRPYRSYATHYLWRSLGRPGWSGLEEAARRARRSALGAGAQRN